MPQRRRAPARRRRVAVTRRLIRRATGSAGRSLRNGSVKMHHFIDRGTNIQNVQMGTSSYTAPNYYVGWSPPASMSSLTFSSTTTGTFFSWSPNIYQMSPVYQVNSVNYNWVKFGKVKMTMIPTVASIDNSSVASLVAGQYILSNYRIPLELMGCPVATGNTNYQNALGTTFGNTAFMLNNYANFQDDPNTKRHAIMQGNHLRRHVFIRDPTIAQPTILSTQASGSAITGENNWSLGYDFKPLHKMSTLNAQAYYYPGVVIYFPPTSSTSQFNPTYSISWSIDFYLIDPN